MAKKIAYSDPSLQLLSFLGNLGGQRTTSTQTSTSSPEAIAALQQILGQQMQQITPEGMNAIINSIFQQGMRQVPKLGMQYAQAAGARTSKNSPLAYASEALQRQLTEAAASALLTAQQNAANTAARYADTTRTTSTSQKTTAPGQKLMALPFLIGQIPNIKKGLSTLGGLFEPDTGFGSVPGGSGVEGFVGNNPSAYIAPSADLVGGSGGIDPALFAGSDMMFDPGSMLTDWQPFTDVVSNANAFDFSGVEGFDLGAFFADGGLVSKKMLTKKAKGYADGGQVRGQDMLAPAANDVTLNTFITNPSDGAGGAADFGGSPTRTPDAGMGTSTDTLGEDVLSYFSAAMSNNSGYIPPIVDIGGKSYALGSSQGKLGPEGEAGADIPQIFDFIYDTANIAPADAGFTANRKYDMQSGKATGYQVNKPETSDFGMVLGGILTALGMATGNPALAFARSVGTRAAGEAVKTGFANGGEIDGPGNGVSDSIPIRVSDGEYIIPADTVEAFGVEFFDMLKDATHTPASMQRFHATGTPRAQRR